VSEIVKDRSVVLRTYPYGETSMIAVALTRSHGKVRFLAKGARRPKSPLQGSLRTGNVAETVFYFRPDRGLQLLKEMDTVGTFESADGDLERLCLFQAGLEIVDRSVVERDSDERLFDMIESFMRLVSVAADPWALFFALEIGVLRLAGSFPSMAVCGRCGRPLRDGPIRVDPVRGLVTCAGCGGGSARAISARSSELLARMEEEGLAASGGFLLGRAERKEIGELLHRFFACHMEGYRLPYALRLSKGVNGQ
jgi:DNA repair protein RecO (recombination protein O)